MGEDDSAPDEIALEVIQSSDDETSKSSDDRDTSKSKEDRDSSKSKEDRDSSKGSEDREVGDDEAGSSVRNSETLGNELKKKGTKKAKKLLGKLNLDSKIRKSLKWPQVEEVYMVMISGWKQPPDMEEERNEFHKRLKYYGIDKQELEGMAEGEKEARQTIKLTHYRSKCGEFLITLVNTSNWRLFQEAEYCHYSMPLDITKIYPELVGKKLDEMDEVEHANLARYTGTASDDSQPGYLDRLMSFLTTDEETDYISAPFRWDKKELFANIDDGDTFFRSSIKSFLTHHILIRTDVTTKKNDEDGINMINNRGLDYLQLKGVYKDVFILHDRPSTHHRRKAFKEKGDDERIVDPRKELWDAWNIWYKFQPIWKIRNYFGEKIAYYFAWIELYTLTLVPVTIIGLIVFLYGMYYKSSTSLYSSDLSVSDQMYTFFTVFNNPLTPWFSFVLCLWGTIFVEQWKRKSNSLKYDWDTSNFEQLEPDRPSFYGATKRTNPITLEEEWYYPFHLKFFKLVSSTMTLLSMVIMVLGFTLGIIVFRAAANMSDWFVTDDSGDDSNNSLYTSVASSVINAVTIMVLGFVYEKIAYALTDWENHRTQTKYEDYLIMKLFAFQFVNNYTSLIYIAFFKDYASNMFNVVNLNDTCEYENNQGDPVCYPMLMLQVAVLLVMKPMPKFFKDVVKPILIHYFKKFRNRFMQGDKYCCCCAPCCCPSIRPANLSDIDNGPAKTIELTDIIEEDRELIIGDDDFTLSEYTEKVIMYGMIILFGAVFPLAPLIAFICNLVDVKVDAYRLLWKNRRYIAARAEDIGIWQYIFEFLNVVGVIVNSLIIALTLTENGSFLDQFAGHEWAVAFAFEHVCFLVKFTIAYIIPDVSSDVQFKMRKEHYCVNKLFENADERTQHEPDIKSKTNQT